MGALVAPGLVLGGLIVMWPDAKDREPRRVVAGGPATSPESPATPTAHPTFGQYVPPKPDKDTPGPNKVPVAPQPKNTAKPPRPRATTAPQPRRTRPPAREICKEYGRRNPWLWHWCERHVYDGGRRDRD